MKFYTYLWLREDGSPYYVGKGCGNRAFRHRKCEWPKPPADKKRIVVNYWPDEETAFAYERYFIDFYGRSDLGTGCLRNMSDGGDGLKNPSAETIRRLSESHMNPSEEVREKLRKAIRKPPPEGTREKAAATNRATWAANPIAVEARREACRAITTELWKDAAFRDKMKHAMRRRNQNKEYRERLSIAIKAYWARKKAAL